MVFDSPFHFITSHPSPESTLAELQANLKTKLALANTEALELIQLWDGKEVDLVDGQFNFIHP